jgi:hypothetical protein
VATRRPLEFIPRGNPQNYCFGRLLAYLATADFCSSAVAFSIAAPLNRNSLVLHCLDGDPKEAAFFADAFLIIKMLAAFF